MKVIVDRFEGEYAVVELPDQKMVNLPRKLVPSAKEGDVVTIEIDVMETKKRAKETNRLMNELWEK